MKKSNLYAIFVALVGITLLALLKISNLLLLIVLLSIWTLAWSWIYERCK